MSLSRLPGVVPEKARVLDETDRAIVAQLAVNPRASYSEIGRAVGLSEAPVRARLLKMIEEASVVVTGRVDPRAVGIGVVGIGFVQSLGRSSEVAERIGKLRDAVYVVSCTGRYDLIVEIRCRDADHLLTALDEIRKVEGVGAVEACNVLRYFKQDWSAVGLDELELAPRPVEVIGSSHPDLDLDDVDKTLIASLVMDGRATFADLARTVDLSQAAVRARVLKLLDEGAVTIQTHTSTEAMGVAGFGGAGIIVDGPVRTVAEALASLPETTLVAASSGPYDVLVEMWWFDLDHLEDLLDRIRTTTGVRTIETLVNVRVTKTDYSAGFGIDSREAPSGSAGPPPSSWPGEESG